MPDDRPPALVLATGLNGLCTVRSLGVAGVPAWAIVDNLRQPCVRSRFCRALVREPGESLLAVLGRLRELHGVHSGVLLATSDTSAQEIAMALESLPSGIRFAGPNRATVEMLMDKRQEIEAVGAVAHCLPRSVSLLDADPDALLARLPLPIILKPRTQDHAYRLRLKNRVVRSDAELHAFYREFADELDSFVAQEVIPGSDETIWQCNAVFDRQHRLVSAFTFQKLGMAPPHFGVTTLGISTDSAAVKALTAEIGRALGYVGPAGFEFKQDPRDGQFKYIEVNPRFAMANWFDTCCGVNTAHRTYRLALGEDGTTNGAQREGVYFLDVYADSYSRIVDDGEAMSSVIGRYLRMLRSRRVAAYWSWRDPLPGGAAAWRRTAQVLRAVRKRLPGGASD
jgi:predicted ATP-grasp superfamily ATP-dependent carboligase